MPRTSVSTSWTQRSVPTTIYTKPRDRDNVPISFDSTEWSFDSTEITFDMTFRDLWPITSIFDTPRKIGLLELENWLNLELENGERLLTEWGRKSNIIDTNWN